MSRFYLNEKGRLSLEHNGRVIADDIEVPCPEYPSIYFTLPDETALAEIADLRRRAEEAESALAKEKFQHKSWKLKAEEERDRFYAKRAEARRLKERAEEAEERAEANKNVVHFVGHEEWKRRAAKAEAKLSRAEIGRSEWQRHAKLVEQNAEAQVATLRKQISIAEAGLEVECARAKELADEVRTLRDRCTEMTFRYGEAKYQVEELERTVERLRAQAEQARPVNEAFRALRDHCLKDHDQELGVWLRELNRLAEACR